MIGLFRDVFGAIVAIAFLSGAVLSTLYLLANLWRFFLWASYG